MDREIVERMAEAYRKGRSDATEAVRAVVLQERGVSRIEVILAAAGDLPDPDAEAAS